MPAFSSTQAIVDAVAAEFAAQALEAEVHLGDNELAKRKDARRGQVVFVPATAAVVGAKYSGKDQKFSVTQELAVHVIAKAAKNVAAPGRQYGDDLTQAEALRNVLLAVMQRKVPFVAEAGVTQVLTGAGENTYGVELILSVTVRLDSPDATYAPNLAPDDTVFDTSCAAVMPSGEVVECCEAEPPAP